MNLFYAPTDQIEGQYLELRAQEARHASKVLRYREGDAITVVDGEGGRYRGTIRNILNDTIRIEIETRERVEAPGPKRVLGMGIIKKRDRLEFAVEKAVELGVAEIALFRGRHTVKENVRFDRLEATALSAMKQSLRAHLPDVCLFDSLASLLEAYPGHERLIAHNPSQEEDIAETADRVAGRYTSADKLLLLVGPEGGFSQEEVELVLSDTYSGQVVSLGEHRLRTETAAVVFLSRFI
ncbi:MAG: RsmE family RNA methyltransferase [Balneolaceae bacterium]|nr:RsmE family RNA methyltransferase [Balneolaceae bacterium]